MLLFTFRVYLRIQEDIPFASHLGHRLHSRYNSYRSLLEENKIYGRSNTIHHDLIETKEPKGTISRVCRS